jgi:hypothetical protein
MLVSLDIPEPLATRIAATARSQGKTAEAIALEAVERGMTPFAELDAAMAPVYIRMEAQGIDEDEAVEDFEREKHALRAERRSLAR